MNNEKFYLGISLGFNSSACVYSSERGLVAAMSQERLNGEKNTKELPFDAMLECIKLAQTDTIDQIGISHYEEISDEYFDKYGKRFNLVASSWENKIISYLTANNITVNNRMIVRVNHHNAHALSTFGFYGTPNKNYYTITSDGFGDGLSAQIRYCHEKVSSVELKNSIGLVYQFVTGALGFKEHQHEGKITGLAAFGEPKYLVDFNQMYFNSNTGNFLDFADDDILLTDDELAMVEKSNIIYFEHFLKLKKTVYELVNDLIEKGAKREDIAASVQEFAEVHTCAWIKANCKHVGADVYIAGGLFANVKINQRIKDLKTDNGERLFKNVYVCPAMGDEGTAVGAAVYLAYNDVVIVDNASDHVICGTKPNSSEVQSILHKECAAKECYNVKVVENTIDYIAKKLADNKIVCLMRGKMEFGPRALCHRSILYNADSKETNDWLNKKLSRTEFMPFAPVCREEVADDLFINLDGGRDSAKFMTMTFDCTEEFAENYKAACHIDNTARPQIVSKDDDPYMWEILRKYQIMTGKKAMINTSFNLHNNPIIESVEVAIRSWLKSDTDVLVINNVVIEKNENVM